jgi:hypothetical protein
MAKLESQVVTMLEYENSSGVVQVPIAVDYNHLITLLMLIASAYHALNGMYNNACQKGSSANVQQEYAAARSNLRLRSIKLMRTLLNVTLVVAVELVDHAIEHYDISDFIAGPGQRPHHDDRIDIEDPDHH